MSPECSDEQESITPQPWKRRKKRLRREKSKTKTEIILDVEWIENYCRNCVEWCEVKPILDMFESIMPEDGPPELWAAITRIKREFMCRLYGHKIKAKNVFFKDTTVNGPVNSFKHNRKVEVGR